jgi:hypothetical protein
VPPISILRPIVCDSCGELASAEHIRERMARLELATRYRPVHIGLLLVCAAPPARLEDDLYAWEQQRASGQAAQYLKGLLAVAGVNAAQPPAAQLAELQRRGVYLARLVECPLAQSASLDSLAVKFGPVLVKRIEFSYKPKHIALLDPAAAGLAQTLNSAGLKEMLFDGGKPIAVPSPDHAASISRVRAHLGRVTNVTDASASTAG